jgi:hypothetical protein
MQYTPQNPCCQAIFQFFAEINFIFGLFSNAR